MGQLFRSPTFVGVILFIVLSLSLVGVINLLLRDVLLLEHEINFTRFGVTQIGSLIGSDEREPVVSIGVFSHATSFTLFGVTQNSAGWCVAGTSLFSSSFSILTTGESPFSTFISTFISAFGEVFGLFFFFFCLGDFPIDNVLSRGALTSSAWTLKGVPSSPSSKDRIVQKPSYDVIVRTLPLHDLKHGF